MSKSNEIRRSFRLLMNGVAAQSQREKGALYHVNWGASLGHLREMAAEYGADFDTAVELWHDNVRESKLMAVLLMPRELFTEDMARKWISETSTQEVAEVASMQLFQYLPTARELALTLCSDTGNTIAQIYGYNILSRLLRKDPTLLSAEEEEKLTQQITTLLDDTAAPMGLRHAAYNNYEYLRTTHQ